MFSAVAALFAAAFDDFETPPLKNDIKVAGFESFDANEWKIYPSQQCHCHESLQESRFKFM